MKPAPAAASILAALALASSATFPAPAPRSAAAAPLHGVAYVNVAKAAAQHPMHALLAQYDREIAALRSTQDAPGLAGIAGETLREGAELQRDAAVARERVRSNAAAHASEYEQRERDALAAILASPQASLDQRSVRDRIARAYASQSSGLRASARSDMATYRDDLARETQASVEAYQRSTVVREQRAFEARSQQLREKESTLAFDLEREDAGRRLLLEVKLEDLHLDAASRARYRAQLTALDARVARRVGTLQHADDAVLAAYRAQLERAAASDDARYSAQTQAKAAANLALRRTVLRAQTSAGGALALAASPAADTPADLPARADALRASSGLSSEATSIEDAFGSAGDDLSVRFAQLRAVDRSSGAATDAQIASLQADRNALFAAIVDDIVRKARSAAGARHRRLVTDGRAPRGKDDLDLTHAVVAEFAPLTI